MMKLNGKDWQALRAPCFFLVVAILIAMLLIHFSFQFATKQAVLLSKQQDQLIIAKQRFLSSGSEKQTITQYLPQYQQLIQKGFIGEENRQLWIQSLQEIQTQFTLFPIEYRLDPLESVKPSFVTNLGGFTMHQSTMQIDFDMLHEGDILRLTESLADEPLTNWLLRECHIDQLAQTKGNGANLTASCTIDWFTLLEPVTH